MTRFWLVRHAIVEPAARAFLYGRMDVSICDITLADQAAAYRAIATRLPRDAAWLVTPLSRTARTADAIQSAGYPAVQPTIEPGLIEQDLGAWQGLPHADLPARAAPSGAGLTAPVRRMEPGQAPAPAHAASLSTSQPRRPNHETRHSRQQR